MAGLADLYGTLLTRVQGVGGLDQVLDHEPLSAFDSLGVVAAVFLADPIAPIPTSSGLAAADARIVFTIRLYRNAFAEPLHGRDMDLLRAFDAVMDALCGGFTLGGATREIDILGGSGEGLRGDWGYVQLDKPIFRIVEISVPIDLNNVWVYGE